MIFQGISFFVAKVASQNLCKEAVKALYLREEVVDESAKGEPVRPAVCEVGDVHVLKKMKKNIK